MLLLENKVAVVHGAGGALGGAVASAFAAAGARVFLTGRTLDPVQATADAIGTADSVVSQVDALDEQAVERHAAMVAETAGRIDVVFNAISVKAVQGTGLLELQLTDFLAPITSWLSSQFLTSRAAARYMVTQRSGVVPYTPGGSTLIIDGLTPTLERYVGNGLLADRPVIDLSNQSGVGLVAAYTLTMVGVELMSDSDRAGRLGPPIRIDVNLAGAQHSVAIHINAFE